MNRKISVVSPVYGDKRNVKLLYDELKKVLEETDDDYEIILVNDCCPYGSGEEIEKIANVDKKVKLLDLSRNFGQHNAIKAGIDYSNGDYVVVMDCDMQDNPSDIVKMYNKIQEGYDIVFGLRKERIDKFSKKFISKSFRLAEKYLSNYVAKYDHGNFSIITKQVADEFRKINNVNFNYRTIIYYLGFKIGYIDIVKNKRAEGTSCYNLYKGFQLAVKRIIANSNKPLQFGIFCIITILLITIAAFIKLIFDYINHFSIQSDIIICLILFIALLLFLYLYIISIYIGAIFQEVKHKPLYVIKRTINI
ncbi:MAG: glycosyltransferase family 2 protein [Candidatus Avigastranaerophilus sp.]